MPLCAAKLSCHRCRIGHVIGSKDTPDQGHVILHESRQGQFRLGSSRKMSNLISGSSAFIGMLCSFMKITAAN